MADHQIVYLFHRTGGGVFNGEDTVFTKSLFNCLKNTCEISHIDNVCLLEKTVAGLLGVSAFHPLTGHNGSFRERCRQISLSRRFQFSGKLSVAGKQIVLIRTAQIKKRGKKDSGPVA